MKAVNERFKRERELIRASKLASRVFLARNRANLWLHRIVLPYRKFIVYASACTSALFLRLFGSRSRDYANRHPLTGAKIIK